MKQHIEMNMVMLSGTINSDLDIRRTGTHRHPIVTFSVETRQLVGKNERPEVVKWKGKCFGATAEKAMTELRKGIRVMIEGSFSGYEPPNRKKTPQPEITVKRFWTNLPMDIGFETEFGETSAAERRKQLEEDLAT